MNATHWDELYRGRDQVFSGHPNEVLVAEAAALPPGRALDAGCGEGADALWLARRGWRVTAADLSAVALRRAASAGTDVRDHVTWTRADLLASPPPAGAFDLVSVHYLPLERRPGHVALRGLLDAVDAGGSLLFVTHALAGLTAHDDFDPAAYYQAGEVAGLLGPAWDVVVDETRPRVTASHHSHDSVLRARRRPRRD